MDVPQGCIMSLTLANNKKWMYEQMQDEQDKYVAVEVNDMKMKCTYLSLKYILS